MKLIKQLMISANLLNLVTSSEGLRLKTYLDPVGIPTIGYGHALPHNTSITLCTMQEAIDWLKADLIIAQRVLFTFTKVILNPNQVDALTDFIFNVGAGSYQRSTLRQRVNRGEYYSVPHELLRWVYAGAKKLPGLIIRRNAEAILFART
jgi:lysozyme